MAKRNWRGGGLIKDPAATSWTFLLLFWILELGLGGEIQGWGGNGNGSGLDWT